MKKLLVALLAVMLVAGSAMALEFDPKGMYYVRGSYINNDGGLSTDPEPYRYWDHELDMTVKMVVSDQTFVLTNFEIHDDTWATGVGDLDDNIQLKKAYGSHTFSTGTQLDFGLMTGEAWATEWNDDSNNFHRVKVMHPFGDHKLYFVVQKDAEIATINGGADVEDLDADDNNTYFIGLDAKLGDISVRPGLAYRTLGTDWAELFTPDAADPDTWFVYAPIDQDIDSTVVEFTLGVEGEMSSIGFEGEFAYESKSWDIPSGNLTATSPIDGLDYTKAIEKREDYSVWGAYLKGWMELGTGKVGGLLAYGSYDDDADEGFGFGEDFAPTGLGANWYPIGETGLYEYNAVTLLWLFAEFEASEALSFDGGFAYWMSNSKDNVWEDANGYELNAGMSYKITDAVTYSAAAQWGQINQDKDNGGEDDSDPATRVWHKLKISF